MSKAVPRFTAIGALFLGITLGCLAHGCGCPRGDEPDETWFIGNYGLVDSSRDEIISGSMVAGEASLTITYGTQDGSSWEVVYEGVGDAMGVP